MRRSPSLTKLRVVTLATLCIAAAAVVSLGAGEARSGGNTAPAAKKERQKRPPKPGVATPGVRREMSSITPLAVFPAEGSPDWQVMTEDAVWVTNAPKNTVPGWTRRATW